MQSRSRALQSLGTSSRGRSTALVVTFCRPWDESSPSPAIRDRQQRHNEGDSQKNLFNAHGPVQEVKQDVLSKMRAELVSFRPMMEMEWLYRLDHSNT